MTARPRIVVAGEPLVEFVHAGGTWRQGVGGDALNIAVNLARCGRDVALATALGGDRFSAAIRDRCAAEGVALDAVTDPTRVPGLYVVATDSAGERSFTYWRSDSAARAMSDLPGSDRMVAAIGGCDVLVYSLITLAILPAAARARLIAAAAAVRERGGMVVFDGNYRPALWPSVAAARAARDAALAECDLGLPTVDDEALLGTPSADDIAAAWHARGVREVVVKLGAGGCRLDDGTVVPPPEPVTPFDTSGAGDAFDAAYLDARLAGAPASGAALAGHRCAAAVIRRSGACPPADG